MTKALLLTALLMLAPLPAASQPEDRDRDSRRGDVEELLREIGDGVLCGRRGGAFFLLRSGYATVAVRCEPQDSMRTCVDATLTLLERARALASTGGTSTPPPVGTPPVTLEWARRATHLPVFPRPPAIASTIRT
jgi:hypothetical protein